MNDNLTQQKKSNYENLPSVAVIILNWNGKHFLESFLPSVVASTYKNIQIIVADNASTDDSTSFLETNFPTIRIIQNKENAGFAKGYNMALQNVEADYFVLLNSDVEVTPNWIEPIIKLLEADKKIAACQPKILDQKRKTHFEYAGASGGFIDSLGYPFSRGRILEILEEDKGQYDDAMSCFWATGACMFVRASVYKELGGLDEYFFAHQEEIDLCWRMQLSGYSVYVQPASVVYHVGGGTLPKGSSKKVYLNFRNNLIMIFKNTPTSSLFLKLPIRMGLDAVAAYKGLFTGDGGYFLAVIKAHIGFYNWLFFYRKKSLYPIKTNNKLLGVYTKSLLWAYYIKKKRKFSEIMGSK
jgi:GT2 family glycosyltransferase